MERRSSSRAGYQMDDETKREIKRSRGRTKRRRRVTFSTTACLTLLLFDVKGRGDQFVTSLEPLLKVLAPLGTTLDDLGRAAVQRVRGDPRFRHSSSSIPDNRYQSFPSFPSSSSRYFVREGFPPSLASDFKNAPVLLFLEFRFWNSGRERGMKFIF